MSKRLATLLIGGGMVGLVLVAVPSSAAAQPSSTGTSYMSARVCATPALGHAACEAVQRVAMSTRPDPAAGHNPHKSPPAVSYYAPQLQDAYVLSSAAAADGAGTTVAVVDAYDDPSAYSDLVAYRNDPNNNLGGIASCSISNGRPQLSTNTACFAKVNQAGTASSYPVANSSWAEEISLDLDTVSAICPKCNILLVEADSNYLVDLGAAENTAASFGPAAIGNSYGGSEFSSEGSFATAYYDHTGIAMTVAAGDSGYGAEFPAAASSVVAVGGTSLREDTTTARGWNETVWSGTGSGCSAYIAKPDWQKDPGCSDRTVGDVAADADPYTGINVYDTYQQSGWLVFGGTSVSAQIIAGVYGLAGGPPKSQPVGAGGLYYDSNSLIGFGGTNGNLNDVTSGSNGSCTGHGRSANSNLAYLCTGATGYDGPTGMGTPRDTTAF